MAASASTSIAEELMNSLFSRSYTGIVLYLSPTSFLTITDFENLTLACDHWLDLPSEDQHKKGQKCCNPDAVFKVFSEYSDYEASEVRVEMLAIVSNKFIYFHDVSWLNMKMHKQTKWMSDMTDRNTPDDELAVFALSRLYKRHSVIYTKNHTWSTISTSKPLSEKDVYLACDVNFVQMGPRNFIALIKKPSSCMPVMQFQPLKNIYEGGYYYDEPETVSIVPKETDSSTEINQQLDSNVLPETTDLKDFPVNTSVDDRKYCAVYGCEITADGVTDQPGANFETHTSELNFPPVIAVCKPATTSKLQEFNP